MCVAGHVMAWCWKCVFIASGFCKNYYTGLQVASVHGATELTACENRLC